MEDARDFYALVRFEEAALALRTVFRLDLIERLGTRDLAVDEFQHEFQFTEQAARTFGALLETMHVLENSPSNRLRVTELAQTCLAAGSEFSRRPYLEMGAGSEVDAFIDLLKGDYNSLPLTLYGREGDPETLMDDEAAAKTISFGLASRARCFAKPLASAIAARADSGLNSLADLGAGSPYVGAACQELMPQLTTTKLVDRANGMKYVQQMLKQDDFDDGRFELCEADFFQAVPAADIYCVSNTAHDWLESEYVEIMSNVRRAIPPNGLVCVHEPLLVRSWETRDEWFEALWMACYAVALFRLTHGKGSCYTVAEHDAIQLQAGFTRSTAPVRTVDGCTALFYEVNAADQDSTF